MTRMLYLLVSILLISCTHGSMNSLKEANKDDYDVIRTKARVPTAYKYALKMMKKCYAKPVEVYTGVVSTTQKYYVEEGSGDKGKHIKLWLDVPMQGKSAIALIEFERKDKVTNIIIYGWGANGGKVAEKLKKKKC